MCEELDSIYLRRWKDEIFPPVLLGATLEVTGNPYTMLSARVRIPDYGYQIAGWNVHRMPALVVISNAWVAHLYQDKGIGKFLSYFRVASFKEMKADDCDAIEMICHCSFRNERQQHILKAVGWERLAQNIWRVK